jgi:hypothetical protein
LLLWERERDAGKR